MENTATAKIYKIEWSAKSQSRAKGYTGKNVKIRNANFATSAEACKAFDFIEEKGFSPSIRTIARHAYHYVFSNAEQFQKGFMNA